MKNDCLTFLMLSPSSYRKKVAVTMSPFKKEMFLALLPPWEQNTRLLPRLTANCRAAFSCFLHLHGDLRDGRPTVPVPGKPFSGDNPPSAPRCPPVNVQDDQCSIQSLSRTLTSPALSYGHSKPLL